MPASYDELKNQIPDIIRKGFSSNDDIECIENFGKYLSQNDVSNSKIRKAYGEVMRLKMQYNHESLLLIQPKLAYVVGRATKGKEAYRHLSDIISQAIGIVTEIDDYKQEKQRFQRLASLFEAILAYHKSHEGG